MLIKSTPGVNIINILCTPFAQIFLCQKITKPLRYLRKATQSTFVWKMLRVKCWWNWLQLSFPFSHTLQVAQFCKLRCPISVYKITKIVSKIPVFVIHNQSYLEHFPWMIMMETFGRLHKHFTCIRGGSYTCRVEYDFTRKKGLLN